MLRKRAKRKQTIASTRLLYCPTYQAMNVHARLALIAEKRICDNCLRKHSSVQCLSKSSCQVCGLRHHTTVHTEKSNESPKPTTLAKSNTGSSASVSQANTSVHVGQNQGQLYIMLGTCMVRAYDAFGSPQYLRALIDGGSQDCFITTACAKKLGLPIRRSKLKVTGIGGNSVPIEGSTHCAIQPCDASEPVFHIHPLVMEKVTTEMPSMAIPSKVKERFKHLMLADGNFDIPSDIDLIIGAEFCADVFEGDKIKLEPGLPVALKSVFGWVITGPIEISYCVSPSTASSLFTTTVHLDDVVKRFWEVEEPPHTPLCSPEDTDCERLYSELTYREPDGSPIPELKSTSLLVQSMEPGNVEVFQTLMERFSSLSRLQRVLAWCLRFINNTKRSIKESLINGPLTCVELTTALRTIIRHVQSTAFDSSAIRDYKGLPKSLKNFLHMLILKFMFQLNTLLFLRRLGL
ncbi:putative peptidase (DUF1758) domain-containing protein [Phthorimaea operculella]|nr:putative peptidase (DUF1758) domain-containing protein [Phthorimaea operculella]